jgi:hypothetical protein
MDIKYIGRGVDYGKEKVSVICGGEATCFAVPAVVITRHPLIWIIRHIATELADSGEINQYPLVSAVA